MKYRIENIAIPEIRGIAQPGTPNDDSRDLGNRRIVHVLGTSGDTPGGNRLRVLTEETD